MARLIHRGLLDLQRDSERRRTFGRGVRPHEVRLGLSILVASVLFSVLFIGNSYVAFGSLFDALIATTPGAIHDDLQLQVSHYLRVSAVIALGYVIAIVAMSRALLHRLSGPIVALERHARALKAGRYSSRITLRANCREHMQLARDLNDLAISLEMHSPVEAANAS